MSALVYGLRRPCAMPFLALLSALISASSLAGASEALPRLRPPDDPRWLRQLPPLTLPLEKPAERAAVAPPLAGEPIEESLPEAAPVEPAPELVESSGESSSELRDSSPEPVPEPPSLPEPVPSLADVEPEPPAVEPSPEPTAAASNTSVQVDGEEIQLGEATEDASMIEVLETLPVSAPDSSGASNASVEPISSVAADPVPDERLSELPYRWHVQILAGRSLDLVKQDQRLFVSKYGDMLQGMSVVISQSRYGDARDDFYRLRVVEWADKQSALDWCDRLQARGHQCYVTRILQRSD